MLTDTRGMCVGFVGHVVVLKANYPHPTFRSTFPEQTKDHQYAPDLDKVGSKDSLGLD